MACRAPGGTPRGIKNQSQNSPLAPQSKEGGSKLARKTLKQEGEEYQKEPSAQK